MKAEHYILSKTIRITGIADADVHNIKSALAMCGVPVKTAKFGGC